MIFNQDIIYIHIGKTGGMSCSSFLEQCLRAPIYSCRDSHTQKQKRKLPAGVVVVDINRHASLSAVEHQIPQYTGKLISEVKKILAVIRNPYTLEYSYYRHLQRPAVIERRKKLDPQSTRLAQGDFKTFVKQAGYHRPWHRQEDFFLINGELPENLELIHFEELSQAFPAAVKPFMRGPDSAALPANINAPKQTPAMLTFPRRNISPGSTENLQALLDEETRELIYNKHRYMFDQGYYSVDSLRD